MRIIPIALSGLLDARRRAGRAAGDIVEAGARGANAIHTTTEPGAAATPRLVRPPLPEVSLIEATVDLKTARTAFAASARLLKTADELSRTLEETGRPSDRRRG